MNHFEWFCKLLTRAALQLSLVRWTGERGYQEQCDTPDAVALRGSCWAGLASIDLW